MPNAKGHIIGAIAFHSVMVPLLSKKLTFTILTKNFLFGLPFVIIGGLIPDADINSYGKKLLIFITICTIAASIALQSYHFALYSVLLLLLAHLSKHRGVMHNPLFLLLIPWLGIGVCKTSLAGKLSINKIAWFSFLNGAFSHILLDIIQTKTKRFLTRLRGQKGKKH